MKKTYHIVNRDDETATASIEQFAKSNGQLLLPLIELLTQARVTVDEVIGQIGRKTIENAPWAERRASSRAENAGSEKGRDRLARVAGRAGHAGRPATQGQTAAPAPQA